MEHGPARSHGRNPSLPLLQLRLVHRHRPPERHRLVDGLAAPSLDEPGKGVGGDVDPVDHPTAGPVQRGTGWCFHVRTPRCATTSTSRSRDHQGRQAKRGRAHRRRPVASSDQRHAGPGAVRDASACQRSGLPGSGAFREVVAAFVGVWWARAPTGPLCSWGSSSGQLSRAVSGSRLPRPHPPTPRTRPSSARASAAKTGRASSNSGHVTCEA